MPETVEMRPWAEHAQCKIECDAGRAERDWWFPVPGESADRAKQICAVCPVIEDCFAWAVAHNEEGVWAGLGRRQRQKFARVKRCVECGKPFEVDRTGGGNQAVTCSPRCRRARKLAQQAESDVRRGRVKNPGKMRAAGHGRPSKYAAGCRCKVCRGGEAQRRARARAARVGVTQ